MSDKDTYNPIYGIDVSHYQGDIFWEKIGENEQISYVYVKASEADDNVDECYAHNMKMAKKMRNKNKLHNLYVGSYHFFRPRKELKQQLRNFTSKCRPEEQDLIPLIDVETTSNMETNAFCDSLMKFLVMVEDFYGQKPLVYTGRNFYNKYLQGKLNDYLLMIAMYSDNEPVLADGREYVIWQYTAKGSINGVNGFVDKSRFVGNHGLREILYHHKSPYKVRNKKKKKHGENGWMVIPDPEF